MTEPAYFFAVEPWKKRTSLLRTLAWDAGGELSPARLSPTELSLLFYTADQRALRLVARLLGVRGALRKGESLGGMVVAKKKHIHLDFDVERHRDGLEWTVYVHENPRARIPRTVAKLSQQVGYLEGFGAWLE